MTHVLVVDDELSIRETFQAILEEKGYDVITAADFFEAESVLTDHPCDVVVADIILPRVNGLSLLQRVREIDEDIPVIMVTGEPDVATAAEAVRRGAYDYIAKPVTLDVLIRVVGRAAEKKRLLDEKRRLEAQNLAYQADLERRVAERTAELERRRQELAALIEIGRDVSATLDLTNVLKRVTQRAAQVCGARRCTILLLGEDGKVATPLMSQFDDSHRDQEMWRLFKEARYPLPVSQVPEAQQVIRERQPLFIPDASASSLPNHLIEPFGIASVLLVPLVSKEQVIGLMALDRVEEEGEFASEQVNLATAIAAQAAVAIENARLFEATSRHVAELEAVHQASLHLTSSLELQPVLEAILEHGLQLVSADDAHVFLYDGERLTFGAAMWAGDRQQEPYAEPRPRGVTYTVARSGERVVIPDTKNHPLFQDGLWNRWGGAIVGMPLHIGDRVQGVMNVAFERPHPFSKDELRTLELLADQAAIAIENARLFEAEQQRRQEAETLYRAARSLATAAPDLPQVFERILGELQQVVPYDSASVQLLQAGRLEIIGGHGFPNLDELLGVTFDLSKEDNPNREVVHRRASLIVDDAPAVYPEFLRDPHAAAGIRAWLGVPLLFGDRLIGILALDKREIGFYTTEHARLAEAFAAQAAIAIENARLFNAARREIAERKLAEEALQERATRLELIARMGQRTTAILALDELLDQAVALIGDVFEYYNVNILLVEGDEIVLRASTFPSYRPSERPVRLHVGVEGITGWVAGSGESLLVPDVSLDDRYCTTLIGMGTRSELAVPIKLKGIVIGVLDAQSAELDAFSQADVFTLQTVADQLAIAIGNARLFEEISRRLAEARLIQEVVLAAASTLDFNLVLERAVKALNRALGVYRLGFLLPDEQGGVLAPHPSLVGFAGVAFQIPIQGSLVGRAYRTGQAVLVRDLAQEPGYQEIAPDARSALAVPVRVGGRVVAVLHTESSQVGAFDEGEMRLFTTIAGQLGVALENARLYQRLEVQAAELSQAYAELQEVNRLRTELVQNVGHELRTPLGLIKGYVELLRNGDLGPTLNSQRSALQIIHERTVTLSRLIHNLTILQAPPREALSLAPVSLVKVVQHALVESRSVEGGSVAFLEELPGELPLVMGDREQLELAFDHLLDNAIKFSPDGGAVTIRAWADQDVVCVSIADEGIGISPKHLDRIFERFYQVDGSTSRRFGGMGVGLALVWEIIEAHGGTVGVESGVGKGSQFTVVLPQAARSSGEE